MMIMKGDIMRTLLFTILISASLAPASAQEMPAEYNWAGLKRNVALPLRYGSVSRLPQFVP